MAWIPPALLLSIMHIFEVSGNTQFAGVNLAGAEFGEQNLPGTFNTDYTYPTFDEVDYFVGKGMNILRIPFRWERVQHELNGPLDSAELRRLHSIVDYITQKSTPDVHEVFALLDPQNFARWQNDQIIGIDVPAETFADFWSKLADEFRNNSNVFFGLVNEPHDMPTETWADVAKQAVVAIRDTGARNLITVPGNQWTGAWSWLEDFYGTPNSVVFDGFEDPGDNFIFEMHQYLDTDSSGTNEACVSSTVGSERLRAATDWLRAHSYRSILAEFGAAPNSVCLDALDDMLDFIDDNTDVWTGWLGWAAGPWWGDYILTLEPTDAGEDRPQLGVFAKHLPATGP